MRWTNCKLPMDKCRPSNYVRLLPVILPFWPTQKRDRDLSWWRQEGITPITRREEHLKMDICHSAWSIHLYYHLMQNLLFCLLITLIAMHFQDMRDHCKFTIIYQEKCVFHRAGECAKGFVTHALDVKRIMLVVSNNLWEACQKLWHPLRVYDPFNIVLWITRVTLIVSHMEWETSISIRYTYVCSTVFGQRDFILKLPPRQTQRVS